MTQELIRQFADALRDAKDPAERERLLSRAKMMAMQDMPEEGFEAPIRTLEEYLESEIEIPPVLVDPMLVVRGGINVIVGRAGKGKEQPHHSKILTPHGWTTMGEILPGALVCNPEGGSSTVVAKFPQGARQTYSVVLSDGSACEAGGDHLWRVRDRHGAMRTVNTLALRPGYGVQTASPADLPSNDYRPLNPWVVGFLLGDGCLVQSSLMFSTDDAEIVDRVRQLLPASEVVHASKYDYRIRGGQALYHVRQLGMSTTAYHKRVPEQYMGGTAASRLEVLRGLMDSDGHSSGQFCSMSRGLVEDVVELTRSLGGRAALHAQGPNGAWRTVVSLPLCPFWLARKADAWSARGGRLDGWRYVRSVTALPGTEECSCIMLGSDNGLYVTDDYIVTHNTTFSLNRILRWGAGLPMFDGWVDSRGAPNLAPSNPLRVLVIENEGAAGMFHRQIKTMLTADGFLTPEQQALAAKNVLIWGDGGYSDLKFDDPKKLDPVRAGIDSHRPDIVFVEPFRSLWSGEENSSTEMNRVVDSMVGIASEFDCACLFSHHEKKSMEGGEDKMSAARGSTVLEGVVTVMENFESIKNGDQREVSWSKSRHGPALPPVRMEWVEGTWWYRWVPDDMIDASIMAAVRTNGDEPMSITDLMDDIDEKNREKVSRACKSLAKEGRLRELPSVPGQRGSTGRRYRIPVDPDRQTGGLSI